ncbi:hypothetical protein GGX14DRAFT_677245 [Mycena pura]|uniref:Uncharacterized protein n=1 Tax=Mycena pura TaxID=153505 RepID=A0AAD6Y5K7_9AGAR|nr:hypothetical protein GGX14DRAFT_677245 [Mycena pura]
MNPGAKTPSQNINGGAIAGGIVGVVVVIGAAIALFLWRRFRRRRALEPMLPTLTPSPLPKQVSSLTMTAAGQTVLAIDQPTARSVVETQEELLTKITERLRRRSGSDREESGNQNVAGTSDDGKEKDGPDGDAVANALACRRATA